MCEMFHADIREYQLPKGSMTEEAWAELNVYVLQRIYDWPLVDPDVAKIYRYSLQYMRDLIGEDCKRVGNGEYVGTIAKRVAKYLRKELGVKAPIGAISQFGNIAGKHATSESVYRLDFTNRIDWRDGEFGDSGSCFWGCRTGAKRMIESNGGYAVRLWDANHNGIGRAFLLPHDGLWFCINAYGPISQMTFARIIASRWGFTYLKIPAFVNNGQRDGTLYINAGATAIGPSDRIAALGDPPPQIDLRWEDDDSAQCASCDCGIDPEDCDSSPDGDMLCRDCWQESYFCCYRCSETSCNDDAIESSGDYYCQYCAESLGLQCCQQCDSWEDDCVETEDGEICSDCIDAYSPCAECDSMRRNEDMSELNGEWYCNVIYHRCINAVSTLCDCCGDRFANDDIANVDGRDMCADCIAELSPATATGEGEVSC